MNLQQAFTWPEIAIFLVTTAMLTGYHIALARKVRRVPMETAIGITNHAREKWVASVMAERRDILAIQTMRNWTMAANFLASTAILMGIGLLSAGFSANSRFSASLNIIGSTSEAMWMLKIILLCGLFFFTFYNFTLSIRYYNHGALMINTSDDHDPTLSAAAVTRVINNGAFHYTIGMRGYYIAIPLALWLFGPIWMLASTFGLIALLRRLDRTV